MDLLRAFVVVVEQRGFSRAGQVLARSQPAVTLQIKRLEEQVGAILLNRKSRRLEPTASGLELLQYARKIIRLNDQAIAALSQRQLTGHVRMGIPNEFAASHLPDVLGKFSREHPDLTLEVVCDLSTHLLTRLEHQELDLAMAIHHSVVAAEHLPWQESIEWVAADNFLFEPDRPVPLVVAPPGCVYRRRVIEALEACNVAWRIVYTGTSYSGIRAAVGAGLGVTALARSTVPDDLRILDDSAPFRTLSPAFVSIHFDAESVGAEAKALINFIRTSL
ncbi:MAG: DNA-binding transcriptional LysR family regulator [Parasphingorhabdus sp.]|jgi:DNA-binding transcriptional LysR family regulator